MLSHIILILRKLQPNYDPDTPNIKEALSGPHRDKFLETMSQEIKELEEPGTWNVIREIVMSGRNSMLNSLFQIPQVVVLTQDHVILSL